jgi:uncharacterized protein YhbP (UPF0306 family)
METLAAINRWLAKQHVVTWCVYDAGEMWCANAFYYYDPVRVAFYVLSEDKTRHAQMTGPAGEGGGYGQRPAENGRADPRVQFKGEIRRLDGEESEVQRKHYTRRFPVALAFKAPVWEIRLDELKFTDNTLGFGKKSTGYVRSSV